MNRYLALKKIIELKSFTKAAESLGYTQSAISQMIVSLEQELSIKLLIRAKTGARLTKEGENLYPFIEKIIYSNFELKEKLKEIQELDSSIIRIGTLASISCHYMPSLIKEFKQQYPNVEIIMHQGDYTSISDKIKTGAVDFGFISPEAVTDINTIPLTKGKFVAILPKGHPLSKNKTIELKDLEKETFILLEEGHYSEPLEAFRKAGLKPDIKYCIHDDYAIMAMVEAGLGISILAELVTQRTQYDIVLKEIKPLITRTIAIGYKDEASLSLASKRFIELIKKHLISQ